MSNWCTMQIEVYKVENYPKDFRFDLQLHNDITTELHLAYPFLLEDHDDFLNILTKDPDHYISTINNFSVKKEDIAFVIVYQWETGEIYRVIVHNGKQYLQEFSWPEINLELCK